MQKSRKIAGDLKIGDKVVYCESVATIIDIHHRFMKVGDADWESLTFILDAHIDAQLRCPEDWPVYVPAGE